MRWQFITPVAPHQNGCAEALVKGAKKAPKESNWWTSPDAIWIIHLFTQWKWLTWWISTPLVEFLTTRMVSQGLFRETRNPWHRVEFVQKIVGTFWRRWTRDVFLSLVPRKKWNADKRTVRVDDIVIMEAWKLDHQKNHQCLPRKGWQSSKCKNQDVNLGV